jgi:hypothetical protein
VRASVAGLIRTSGQRASGSGVFCVLWVIVPHNRKFAFLFSAALPMCGVLSGGVATWYTALDSAFGFQQLVDPSVQVVNITNPGTNLSGAEAAVTAAQQTPQGRARLALAAALADTPGWFTPLSAEPAPGDYAAQEANQYLWDTQVDFPFVFAFRAELEARAGVRAVSAGAGAAPVQPPHVVTYQMRARVGVTRSTCG